MVDIAPEEVGPKLGEDLSRLLICPDSRFSDFKIICANQTFSVHKNILACRSGIVFLVLSVFAQNMMLQLYHTLALEGERPT